MLFAGARHSGRSSQRQSLDFLDGVVFPHTCDSFQRLSDIWRLNIARQFHLDVVLPVKLDTPSAKKYLYDVLEKFRKDLGAALGVNITDKMLAKSIKTYNKIRALIRKLYELRSKNPEILSGADFHAVIKAAMIMDRDYFLEALSEIVGQLKKAKPAKAASRREAIGAFRQRVHSSGYLRYHRRTPEALLSAMTCAPATDTLKEQ